MSKSNQNILGIYTYVDVLVDAIKKLRAEGFENLRVFSPVPNHEIEDALDTGKEPSKVKYFTFCGAILGALVGVCFTVLTSIDWPIVTSAKPIVSIPPYMIIIFECMILIGGLSTFLGLIINSRLRKDTSPQLYDERFNIIVISLSKEFEPGSWGLYKPSWVEIGITVGSFAWFFMFFLIFVRTLPALSIAEIKEILPVPKKNGGSSHE